MSRLRRRWPAIAGGGALSAAIVAAAVLVWGVDGSGSGSAAEAGGDAGGGDEAGRRVAVEVAPVERGTIESTRVFNGSLEPARRVVIASRVAGRIAALRADLGDAVELGEEIAALDADEFEQELVAAEAELAVAKADLAAAEDRFDRATRQLERTRTLRERGIASESQLESATAEHQAAGAERQMAEARIRRHEADRRAAELRLGHTSITARWSDNTDAAAPRLISQRFVDDGDTVSANEPLFELVAIDPIKAVLHATPRDYTRLSVGQPVSLRVTGHEDRAFDGTVARLSPVFRDQTRQARIEVAVDNPDFALKPGMFAQVRVVLDVAEDAVIVPREALTRRDGQEVLFVLADESESEGEDAGEAGTDERVRQVAVELGIEREDRVQIVGDAAGRVRGDVVVLGQQMLEDGTHVRVHDGGM